jgi:hypothetical protein
VCSRGILGVCCRECVVGVVLGVVGVVLGVCCKGCVVGVVLVL